MGFLKVYIKKYYKMFLAAISCIMLEVIFDLFQPTLMAKVIDNGVLKNDINQVLKYGLMMVGVSFIGAIVAINRNKFATTVAQDFGADLRNDIFTKIQSFDFDNIDNFERSSLITRMTNDVTNIQNFIYGLMRILMRAPLLAIGCIIMAIRLDFRMSLIIIGIVPVVTAILFFSIKITYPYFLRVQKALDKVNRVIREYLRGVRVVKAFNRFNYEEEKFNKVNNDLTNETIITMKFMAISNPIAALIVNITIILIIYFGARRVNYGTLEVGKIIALINYMTQMLFALTATTMIFSSLIRAKTSGERVTEVLKEEINIKEIKERIKSTNRGSIEFSNVSFSYKNLKGEPILKDITFNIQGGTTLGIVGSTGSGKTTLINLLPRFYEVQKGYINVDDVNVNKYSFEELRSKIAIVPQRPMLFTGTIKENIRWGKEAATDKEIEEVCKIAGANEFIKKLENKYDSKVEQGGANFSGGQKQRLAIARALIKSPEILILDDSTSALDTVTESEIRKALKTYSKNLTTIIIAQKISSVKDSDKIIVLDNGEIVGKGTHEELLKSSEVYRDIFKAQQ